LRNEADEERILAEAETVHVCVDKQMQKRNLPEKYAAAILETME
jgi:acyl-CoA thioesterase FadM